MYQRDRHKREDVETLIEMVLEDLASFLEPVFGSEGIRVTASNRQTEYRLGTAWITQRRINIYWRTMSHYRLDAIEDVIRHEIAHLYAYATKEEHGHGRLWKEVAELFGARPFANSSEDARYLYATSNRSTP